MIRILFFIVFISFSFGFSTLESSTAEKMVLMENNIVVSPNPAVSVTKVISKDSSKKIKAVKVFSVVNEEVISLSNRFPSNALELNVFNLRNGRYFVKVFLSDGTEQMVILVKTS